MKKLLFLCSAVTLFLSCSPDSSDDNGGDAAAYLSMKNGNYWKYEIHGANFSGIDSVYVANDTTISGKTYKKFKTRNEPIGFFSNSISNNSFRASGGKIMMTGTAASMLGFGLPVDLLVEDMVVFKDKASEGEVLDTFKDQVEQEMDGLPLLVDYQLKAVAGPSFNSFTDPQGNVYSDVKSVKTSIQIKVTTTLEVIPGFPQTVLILDTQDVITSQQFFAKGIGVVHTATSVQYEMESFPVEVDLPFPQSFSDNHYEILLDHHVN